MDDVVPLKISACLENLLSARSAHVGFRLFVLRPAPEWNGRDTLKSRDRTAIRDPGLGRKQRMRKRPHHLVSGPGKSVHHGDPGTL